jgi:SAM-dependent methyltransferase
VRNRLEAQQRQHRLYTEGAHRYDRAHVESQDQHFVALEYILGLMTTLRLRSLLDVGTGTGRSLRFMAERSGDVAAVGVDPVEALLRQAVEHGDGRGGRTGPLVAGRAERLPFRDGAFDAVCATGMLHHVPAPQPVVAEMLRVARSAIFLSDSNRFGQGSTAARLVKLGLYKAGLWRTFMFARTKGRGYQFSEDDGVFYSYSVYDSFSQVKAWSTRTILLGTDDLADAGPTWAHPLLDSSHVLLCGLREPLDRGWADLAASAPASGKAAP